MCALKGGEESHAGTRQVMEVGGGGGGGGLAVGRKRGRVGGKMGGLRKERKEYK